MQQQSLSRTTIFFKGAAVFVIRVQRCCLCFIWTAPSALAIWTSPPVFYRETPKDKNWRPSGEPQMRSGGVMHSFPVKGTQRRRGCVENIIRRRQVCMSESAWRELFQIFFNLWTKEKPKENGRDRRIERHVGLVNARRGPGNRLWLTGRRV